MPSPESLPPLPTAPAERTPRRARLACPRCKGAVRRRRRNALQRRLAGAAGQRRFRCTDQGCGWTGLLATRLDTDGARRSRRLRQALWGLVPLALGALVIIAAQWGAARAPTASIAVGPRHFAPGQAFDGAMPPRKPSALAADRAAATRADDAKRTAAPGASGPGA